MCAYRQIERVVRDKVHVYEVEYDFWKADHDAAIVYFDFRDLLRDGIKLYRDICLLDENWRAAVYSKDVEYDTDFSGKLGELFASMFRLLCQTRDALLPYFEQEYDHVEHADEFRECCKELENIHTPDADFFCHDELVDLRDAALDEVG